MSSVQEEVHRQLRQGLLDGRWRAGEKLSELKLAAELGVNRNPIREALLKLAAEGLLERTPGIGCRVPQWDFQAVTDMYQLREAIEGMAARLAAQRITTVQLIRLEQENEMQARLYQLDQLGETAESDNRFHRQLIECGGNRALVSAWEHNRILAVSRRQLFGTMMKDGTPLPPRDPNIALKAHRRIITALEGADPDEAEAAARVHIRTALAHFTKLAGLLGEPAGKAPITSESTTALITENV